MKISQKNLAAQLFTCHEYTKTPKDIAETLKKVKKIGYDAVQISALGPIDPKELGAMLEGEGLFCCASHDGGDDLFNKTDALIEKLHAVKCPYVAYPWPHTRPGTEEEWVALAKRLDAVGAKLREAGITLCYHNHNIEFTNRACHHLSRFLRRQSPGRARYPLGPARRRESGDMVQKTFRPSAAAAHEGYRLHRRQTDDD